MSAVFEITQNDPQALSFAIENARQEGWNPGVDDHLTFLAADPEGFFLGKLNGQPIACASAVCYNDHFAFCGLYIVLPEYRGQGYGMQLTHQRLAYVGNRCVGLDGVVENENMYEKIGYQRDFISHRFAITRLPGRTSIDQNVKLYEPDDLRALINYDRLCFPASRSQFLKAWVGAPHATCFCVYDHQGQLQGYIVIRRCYEGYKVGPLFADSRVIAQALLRRAMDLVSKRPVFIDVPAVNLAARALMNDQSASSQFSCVRMYRQGKPVVDTSRVYGITTFELG